MNITKFAGQDPHAWIQNLEQYFAAARTPLDHRTELAISYLTGPAMEWWIGAGYNVQNVPWHGFCAFLSERFFVTSACENVKSFHSISQTGSLTDFVRDFEHSMNLVVRTPTRVSARVV